MAGTTTIWGDISFQRGAYGRSRGDDAAGGAGRGGNNAAIDVFDQLGRGGNFGGLWRPDMLVGTRGRIHCGVGIVTIHIQIASQATGRQTAAETAAPMLPPNLQPKPPPSPPPICWAWPGPQDQARE